MNSKRLTMAAAMVAVTALGAPAPTASAADTTESVTFAPAGPVMQSWMVPAGVVSVELIVDGASGGLGAGGARVTLTQAVTAGSVLDIWVGLAGTDGSGTVQGLGGWGGRAGLRHGGNGGTAFGGAGYGSGGGGATEVDLRNGTPSPLELAVASGGGGAGALSTGGCSVSGSGGCGARTDNGRGNPGETGAALFGASSNVGSGGSGADASGGLGGAAGAGASGANGESSATGAGGAGGSNNTAPNGTGGGGGGGGFGGGGGGGAASEAGGGRPGGGGSGRSLPGTAGTTWGVAPVGSGSVRITYVIPPAQPGATAFVPLTPARLLDTREPTDITAGSVVAVGGGIDVQVTGRGGVPATGVAAVVLNVTVAGGVAPGFVTVWPSGEARPTASNLNVTAAGQNIANLVTVKLAANGMVSLFTQSGAHLVVDVEGYYAPTPYAVRAGRFKAVAPARVLDTRSSVGVPGTTAVPADGQVDVTVAGRVGVPATGAAAVVLNVTAASATAPGFVTVWPTGQARPKASTLNVTFVGQNIANQVIVPVGADGRISIYTQSGTHLVADVLGWFTDGVQPASRSGLFEPLPPARLLDTRAGNPPGTSLVPPQGSIELSVVNRAGVPSVGAASVVINVTAAESTQPGFVTVWPADQSKPTASNLNITAPGQNIANLVTVGMSATGTISLFTSGGGHLVGDVAGYYISA